jgi:methionyl-tRNA synthetase
MAAPGHFYVTTPIYYVNAAPTLGAFYTTVIADAFARYHRARGHQTFFLTGTDEHGQKIEREAQKAGITPKAFCDQVVVKFKETWTRAQITHDRFIRTTDDDHRAAVEEMWKRIAAKGDLYEKDYDALYCVGCEGWKTDEDVVEENGEKLCAIHRKPVERVKEKNWFFRLSKYGDQLLALYERGFVRPESRKNEVAEFVKSGLRDLSVSRSTVKWGIPVPGDPKQVVYVWLDALTNYVSALGGPAQIASPGPAQTLWTNCTHLIAKDILRFHAVFWPAFLLSADLPLPKGVFCHGYLTVKGQKIAKSVPATRVDPNAIADEMGSVGIDPLRYFVLREYTFGADGDFSYEGYLQRYESDLGNDLGNLVNRTLSLAKNLPEAPSLPAQSPRAANDPLHDEELSLRTDALTALADAEKAWEDLAPGRALEATWAMVRRGNAYVDRTAPWKLAKAGQWVELRAVLGNACEIVRRAALMVTPAMPGAAREILRQIGRAADEGQWPDHDWTGWPGAALSDPTPIFPRFDADKQAALIGKWTAGLSAGTKEAPAAAAPAPAPAGPPAEITFDDFGKIDLRVAKVLAAEKVPKTDKLLKLTLDLGSEQRTVVSGIAGSYAPETLVGRSVVLLANLKPAKLRGILSQGMILAAGDGQTLALLAPDKDLPPGTKIS